MDTTKQSQPSGEPSPTGGQASSPEAGNLGPALADKMRQLGERQKKPGSTATSQAKPGCFKPPSEIYLRNAEAARVAQEASEKANEQDRRASLWKEANVPKRHRELQRSGSTEWSEKLAEISAQSGSGYLIALLGPRGTGKTQLAVELVRNSTIVKGRCAVYARTIELFMDIKGAYDREGPSESSVLSKYARPELLVLDEAQERGDTDWENRMLTYLIDRRYGEMNDTLLVSNLKADDFRAAVGLSIYSRLVETGGIVVCDWPSFRAKGASS